MAIEIITTKDGSKSLFLTDLNETYHSKFGARTESEYVFINAGFNYIKKHNIRIFEVGFGTGLNVLLTVLENRNIKKNIYYESIEKYPLSTEILIPYMDFLTPDEKKIFMKIHQVGWNEIHQVDSNFKLLKKQVDLLSYKSDNQFDIVYFDAFAPDKQPDLWTEQIFEKMYRLLDTGGILVTYSAKGSVRRTLQSIGFTVERLPGPPGKREMLRAQKK